MKMTSCDFGMNSTVIESPFHAPYVNAIHDNDTFDNLSAPDVLPSTPGVLRVILPMLYTYYPGCDKHLPMSNLSWNTRHDFLKI